MIVAHVIKRSDVSRKAFSEREELLAAFDARDTRLRRLPATPRQTLLRIHPARKPWASSTLCAAHSRAWLH